VKDKTLHEFSAFRRRVAKLVVLEAPHWARFAARKGLRKNLAAQLGVTEAVLIEATRLLRAGFMAEGDDRPPLPMVRLRIKLPIEKANPLAALATTVQRNPTQLTRDLLHAVMQLTREPAQTSTLYGHDQIFRGRRLSGKRLWLQIVVSAGLAEALTLRAVAFGTTRHAYMRCWITDLIEGRLGDLEDLPTVQSEQTFESAQSYVLPVLLNK